MRWWTNLEEKRLLSLWNDGEAPYQIAKKLSRTPVSVLRKLDALGVQRRRKAGEPKYWTDSALQLLKERRDSDVSNRDIAAELGISVRAINYAVSHYDLPTKNWTESKRDLLRKLWERGDPIDMIAFKLGVTRNSIAGKRKRMGLPERPVHPNFQKKTA